MKLYYRVKILAPAAEASLCYNCFVLQIDARAPEIDRGVVLQKGSVTHIPDLTPGSEEAVVLQQPTNHPFVDDRKFPDDTYIIRESAIGYHSMVLGPWKPLGRDIVAASDYLMTGRNALEG